MSQIQGNILNQRGIVCHQVNMRGVMGAGLALQIRQKWPDAYTEYVNYCRKGCELGDIIFSNVSKDVTIAHLFGQNNFGKNGCMTNYSVYPKMLKLVDAHASSLNERVYIPHGMGCGLGGGDWSIMLPLIEEYCTEAIIVKYENTFKS